MHVDSECHVAWRRVAQRGNLHEKSPRPKPTSELLISQGADPIDSTAEEFRDRIKADLVKWTATIATAGVRLERYCV